MRQSPSKAAQVQRTATIPVRDDGGIRLVVVADTHGNPHPKSSQRIAAERPDAILHAGDIGDARVLEELASLAPVFAVRGNVDGRAANTPDVLIVDVRSGESSMLRILLVHIAVYGPKLHANVARLAQESGAGLVVCGHSHVPFIGRDRGLGIFNPGSMGPRRFHLPIVFGVLEIENGALTMRHVDCETGQTWAP